MSNSLCFSVVLLIISQCVLLSSSFHTNLSLSFNRHVRDIRATALPSTSYSISEEDDALEKTKKHLEKMEQSESLATLQDGDALYAQLIKKPANTLKEELKSLKLQTKGRKPDLAKRLVAYHINSDTEEEEIVNLVHDQNFSSVNANLSNEDHSLGVASTTSSPTSDSDSSPTSSSDSSPTSEDTLETLDEHEQTDEASPPPSKQITPLKKFASIPISVVAGTALAKAAFNTPTPIQETALPLLAKDRESLILHAETGSGKTLCYLLPITERLWKETTNTDSERSTSFALILTPTRELAAQVAGVATALAPPNSVRLITTPTNLLRDSYEQREKSEGEDGGRFDNVLANKSGTKIIVGSAKSILLSLFGDSKLHPPTSKPEARQFLSSIDYLTLDEVDRLFNIKTSRGKTSKYYKKHDKPAAVVTSMIARSSLGQAQIVAASATVGRPLRRELARILGLAPDECPRVVRAAGTIDSPTARKVSVPKTLKHYVLPCDGSTSGSLLTTAAFLTKGLSKVNSRGRKTLFVITKACGIPMKDAIGALQHFGVQPKPKALLDVLEADGTDRLMETYRQVSGASGLGERATNVSFDQSEGYLLVTGEDTVRGIHLDELDTVVVVGRPKGPDEYIHIAGRAGRAGKPGSVVNIVSYEQTSSLTGWKGMLGLDFVPIDESEISSI